MVEHPATGKRCWFNQIAFLNEWVMKPEVREFLIGMYGEDGLPFTTLFGDGEPISPEIVETINEAYDACTIREPLRAGRLAAVLLGVAGVAILVGPEAILGRTSRVIGIVCLVGAAASYAMSGIWGRRFKATT